MIVENKIATLTTCFRNDLYVKYKSEITPDPSWKMGDYPAWLYFAHSSKVHFINEPTAVYRVLENSASHNNNIEKEIQFLLSAQAISVYFAKLYNKEYLIRSIKLLIVNGILSLCLERKMSINERILNIVKSEKVLSFKILAKLTLLSYRILF